MSLSRLWPNRMVSEWNRCSSCCWTSSSVVSTPTKCSAVRPLNLNNWRKGGRKFAIYHRAAVRPHRLPQISTTLIIIALTLKFYSWAVSLMQHCLFILLCTSAALICYVLVSTFDKKKFATTTETYEKFAWYYMASTLTICFLRHWTPMGQSGIRDVSVTISLLYIIGEKSVDPHYLFIWEALSCIVPLKPSYIYYGKTELNSVIFQWT